MPTNDPVWCQADDPVNARSGPPQMWIGIINPRPPWAMIVPRSMVHDHIDHLLKPLVGLPSARNRPVIPLVDVAWIEPV
ncbi:hypothetical protein [Thalassoglobus sp.]|uniref:hypothetical protein n=1 Tax=Thalassoglobus sp. TaxID=2795869 RepID=UPI003AA96A57